MRFMLLVHGTEDDWRALERAEIRGGFASQAAADLVGGGRLGPPAEARLIRAAGVRGTQVMAGPLTRDHLLGFWVVDCAALANATLLAVELSGSIAPPGRAPLPVEVRAMMSSPGEEM